MVAAGGCGRRALPEAFAIRSAAVERGSVSAQLDWRPSALMLDALDHGIALDFEVVLEARGAARFGWPVLVDRLTWHRELRYFPLTRQYQLRDPDQDPARDTDTRNYPARALLIAAMSDLRLGLPADWPADANRVVVQSYSLRIDLQRDNLPGALRLPALIDADWRLSTGNYTWLVTPNAG
ncbi:MAG: DUF4390 domain-containing protein [Rudaea sp.]